jgi:hypothetical protein
MVLFAIYSLIVNLHLISLLAICVVQLFNPGVVHIRVTSIAQDESFSH